MDTAAILQCLDFVVTSDTSVAHLAGALGVKTCIILGFTPDGDVAVSIRLAVVPDGRLFRQTEIGNWDTVAQEVADYIQTQWAERAKGG